MKRFLGSLVDLRPGEVLMTVLMFASYYTILLTYYFLKPARDSLFLVKVDPLQLPLVFIVTALITVPVVALYSRASRSLKLNKLISVTLIILIVNLVIMRWLIQRDDPWVYYLFYTWVSIYGALTTSQFWLLGNAVFDASQAKRIFVLLGLGGIVGAFTGGQVTSIIVDWGISTPDLLFFCIGFLAVVIVLVNIIWRLHSSRTDRQPSPKKSGPDKKANMGQVFGTIKRSRHLTLIVGIIALTMMVASFVDYQFKIESRAAFTSEQVVDVPGQLGQTKIIEVVDSAKLTSFLGSFYGWLSLVSFILQAVFTYRFIRILGVGGIIMFLPLGLLAGSAAMVLYPGLIAAVLLRGADGSIKYSIDKTGRELLFLPVPLDIKKRTKLFIDVFVDRWFRGLAGGLLLLCTMWLGLTIRQISFVVIALVAVWLVLAVMMRREYINSFRTALAKRRINPEELTLNITDGHVIKTLIASLSGDNQRQITYALDMLSEIKDKKVAEAVRPFLKSDVDSIRQKALAVISYQEDDRHLEDVTQLLDDPDPIILRDAIAYVCHIRPESRVAKLSSFLSHENHFVRAAAVSAAVKYGSDEERNLITKEIIESLIDVTGPVCEFCRIEAARALGVLKRPSLIPALQRLQNDQSEAVVNRVIISIGQLGDRQFIPWLMDRLGQKNHRASARLAFASYGRSILGTLNDYLSDTDIGLNIRSSLPRVMSQIPHQETVDLLSHGLESSDPRLKYYLVKGLNRLRSEHPDLKFSEQKIDSALMSETKSYFEILQILQIHRDSDSPHGRLLAKALIEKQDHNLEQIFRLLGLSYPSHDIYNAYLGIKSSRRELRASAVEFLDNLLASDLKKYIMPVLDDIPLDTAVRKGQTLFGIRFISFAEALTHLIGGRDCWIKACAIFASQGIGSDDLDQAIINAQNDADPIVKETARLIIKVRGLES